MKTGRENHLRALGRDRNQGTCGGSVLGLGFVGAGGRDGAPCIRTELWPTEACLESDRPVLGTWDRYDS